MALLAKSSQHTYVQSHKIYEQITQDADHVDIKSVESDVNMNQFVAGVFNFQPQWVTFLYQVRQVFVRFLGMRQEGIPQTLKLTPGTLNLEVGGKIGFFDIEAFQPDHYLIVVAEESHLKARLAIFREPLMDNISRYYAVTVVHYNNWAGPVYFNVIRPFHHLVVQNMLQAGVQR